MRCSTSRLGQGRKAQSVFVSDRLSVAATIEALAIAIKCVKGSVMLVVQAAFGEKLAASAKRELREC